MATKIEKLPAIEPKPNPCLHCPDPQKLLSMKGVLAVGFGDAHLQRDGKYVLGENDRDNWIKISECERIAAKDPEHDWRIVLHGPLHGETYQRQGKRTWVCVEQNEGFA